MGARRHRHAKPTAVADCITFTTSRRSADLTFATCSGRQDAVPEVEVFVRRTKALRRFCVKHKEARGIIDRIYEAYRKKENQRQDVDKTAEITRTGKLLGSRAREAEPG